MATLSFRNNPQSDVLFYLEFDARADLFPAKPQQVTVYAGNQVVDHVSGPAAAAPSSKKIPDHGGPARHG